MNANSQRERFGKRMGPALVLVASLLTFGCGGGGKIPVSGQLQWDGQPYQLQENEQVGLVFQAEEKEKAAKEQYIGKVERDGSFKVAAANGEGIPPGKYRVTVSIVPMNPKSEKKVEDKTRGAFAGASSPHVVEVASGKSTFNIELNPAKVK